MADLIERLRYVADDAGGHNYGVSDLLREAAAALEAAREDAEPDVRFNDDGTLDEIVGSGKFHLEQMGHDHWWMQLGPHMVNLSARGKIRAHFGRNEAAIDRARGKAGQEVGNG